MCAREHNNSSQHTRADVSERDHLVNLIAVVFTEIVCSGIHTLYLYYNMYYNQGQGCIGRHMFDADFRC